MIASGSSRWTPVAPTANASSGANRRMSGSNSSAPGPASCQAAASIASGVATTRTPGALSTCTVALRIVEGRRRDDGFAPIDLDAVRVRQVLDPAEHHGLAEHRGGPAPGHVPDDRAVDVDRGALERGVAVHREAVQQPFVRLLRGA